MRQMAVNKKAPRAYDHAILAADEDKAKKEKRDFHVVDSDPRNAALYVAPVETRKHKKIFDAAYHIAEFDWSPDSRFIAFSHTPTPSVNDWPKSDVSEVCATDLTTASPYRD